MPNHKVFIGNGKTWLVVSHLQGTSGSGVSLFFDSVFEVDSKGIKEVLSYVSDGQQGGGHEEGTVPNRSFSAFISNYEKNKNYEFITVTHNVSYDTWAYVGEQKSLSLLE